MKNKVIVKRMLIMLLVILVILGSINLFWYVLIYAVSEHVKEYAVQ